jgi:hypothetical protein
MRERDGPEEERLHGIVDAAEANATQRDRRRRRRLLALRLFLPLQSHRKSETWNEVGADERAETTQMNLFLVVRQP